MRFRVPFISHIYYLTSMINSSRSFVSWCKRCWIPLHSRDEGALRYLDWYAWHTYVIIATRSNLKKKQRPLVSMLDTEVQSAKWRCPGFWTAKCLSHPNTGLKNLLRWNRMHIFFKAFLITSKRIKRMSILINGGCSPQVSYAQWFILANFRLAYADNRLCLLHENRNNISQSYFV